MNIPRLSKYLIFSSCLALSIIIASFLLNYWVQSSVFSWQESGIELNLLQKSLFIFAQIWTHYFYLLIPCILSVCMIIGIVFYFVRKKKQNLS